MKLYGTKVNLLRYLVQNHHNYLVLIPTKIPTILTFIFILLISKVILKNKTKMRLSSIL